MIFRKRRRIAPQVNITSLIDVVLLLLIFFMISTTFVTQPGIRVNLPNARSQTKDIARETNTVIITAENTIFINREQVHDVEELRTVLDGLQQKFQGDLVVIKADENVAHGLVVRVMDIAKSSGFSRIAIATR